ncbi:MAG: AtpZ/AtpI family protein [Gemmatimonadetes bacterium]|nr:AtpZ/AtpI family protein [Gemmatimonadota bacterium]
MDQPPRKRDEEGPDPVMVSMARYSGYGLQLAAAVGLFMAVGWWVDGKLGTTPLLTILGALGGGAAGFYSLYLNLVKNRDPDR